MRKFFTWTRSLTAIAVLLAILAVEMAVTNSLGQREELVIGNAVSPLWEISIVGDELFSDEEELENMYLIYGIKSGYHSDIFKRDTTDGTQEVLLQFEEVVKAVEKSNYWESLPPSISLSNDMSNLVYINELGLKTYDLSSKKTSPIINMLKKGSSSNDGVPESMVLPKWSEQKLSKVFFLTQPKWSFSDRYISFSEAFYGSSRIGMWDREKRVYSSINIESPEDISWSQIDDSFVITSSSQESAGLYVSPAVDLSEMKKISNLFASTESRDLGGPFFKYGIFINDDERVLFTFKNFIEDEFSLGIVNRDGSSPEIIYQNINMLSKPIYSPKDNSVLFVEEKRGMPILVKYDLEDKRFDEVLSFKEGFYPIEEMFWSKEGYLVVVGSLEKIGDSESRVLVLDMEKERVVYVSPLFSKHTMFIGFIK